MQKYSQHKNDINSKIKIHIFTLMIPKIMPQKGNIQTLFITPLKKTQSHLNKPQQRHTETFTMKSF